MKTFEFEGMDKAGQEVRDSVVAKSQEDAQAQIRQMGYFVTKISCPEDGAWIAKMDKKIKKGIGPGSFKDFGKYLFVSLLYATGGAFMVGGMGYWLFCGKPDLQLITVAIACGIYAELVRQRR